MREQRVNRYVVGDVQGCSGELRRLLEAVNFDAALDQLWLVGDLVSRGPDSLGTVRLARELDCSCVTVLGNHDLSVLAQLLGNNPALVPGSTARELAAAPDANELLAWLRNRPLAHLEDGFLMVHAGLSPQWSIEDAMRLAAEAEHALRGPEHAAYLGHMYGDEPRLWDESLEGVARWRYIINCFSRLRYCHPTGQIDLREKRSPSQAGSDLLPWFALPQRRSASQEILFGHWSTLGQVHWPAYRVWGLDTGCVWGGRLTALKLPERRLVQVPSPGYRKIS